MVCEPVQAFAEDVQELAADLLDTLYATSGIALSAPQLGVLRQVLVMDLSSDRSAPEVYVNPEILSRSKPGLVEETCLSLPGVAGNVFRHTQVQVRAKDAQGEPLERELSGMHAVALQHEMDHFAGTLFVERLSRFKRWRLRRKGLI